MPTGEEPGGCSEVAPPPTLGPVEPSAVRSKKRQATETETATGASCRPAGEPANCGRAGPGAARAAGEAGSADGIGARTRTRAD